MPSISITLRIYPLWLKSIQKTYQMLAFCEETTLPRPSSYYLKTPFKGNIGDNLPTIRDKIKEVGKEMAQDPLKLAEIRQLKALCDNIIRSSPKESEAIILSLIQELRNRMGQSRDKKTTAKLIMNFHWDCHQAINKEISNSSSNKTIKNILISKTKIKDG